MVGWIKLHRKTINSAIFDNPHLLKMWIWCLLKATHDEYEQMVGLEKITLKQGQFITGRNKGSAELSVNQSTWYKHIKTLEKMQMVELKSNNKKTVVTIVNWALYQGNENNCNNKITTKEQQNNNKITTKEQQNNTNKNIKNIKNIKNGENNRKEVCVAEKNDVPDKEDLIPEDIKKEVLEFIKFRKEIKSAITEHGIKLLLGKLEKLAPNNIEEQKEIINQSIVNGWKGIFEVKKSYNKNNLPQMSEQERIMNL